MPQRNLTIRDEKSNIEDKTKYPIAEGQAFYATDTGTYYLDRGGQRTIVGNGLSIMADENIRVNSKTPRNQLIVSKSPSGAYVLSFVDDDGGVHELSQSFEDIQALVGRDGLDGINNYIISIYTLTDLATFDISGIERPIISGTYNFNSSNLTDITLTSGWTTNLEDLEFDDDDLELTEDNKYKIALDLEGIPHDFIFNKTDVTLVVSKAIIISRKPIYEFEDIQGDIPSRWSENLKSDSILLYFKTDDPNPDSLPARDWDSIYTYQTRDLVDITNTEEPLFNGWSLNLPEPDESNRYVFMIATTASSNKSVSLIPSSQWNEPKLFLKHTEDASFFDIVTNVPVIYKDSDSFSEEASHTPVVAGFYLFKGNNEPSTLEGELKIRYRENGDGDYIELGSGNNIIDLGETSGVQYLELEGYSGPIPVNSDILDTAIIPVVLKGLGAITLVLTNDHAGINFDKEGNPVQESVETDILVFENHKNVTNDFILSIENTSGLSSNPTIIGNKLTVNTSTLESEALFGAVLIRATRETDVLEKEFTFGVSRDGIDGLDGIGIESITQYYAINNSSSIAPTVWETTVVSPTPEDRFLWTYEIITYTEGNPVNTTERVIGIYGETGASGLGIESILEEYQISDESTNAPTGDWSGAPPTITTENPYLWNKTTITYTDSSTHISTVLIGAHGPKGDDAKYIIVEGDQAFKYEKGETTPTQEIIELTRTLFNVDPGSWYYFDGTIWQDLKEDGNLTVNHDGAIWEAKTKLTFKYESGDRSDQITIVKLFDAEDGNDAIVSFLTNETHTVPSDFDGNNPDLSDANTQMKIFEGITESMGWSFSKEDPSGISSNINSETGFLNITGMTANVGTVTITATKAGYSDVVKVFSLSKSKQGIQGEGGNDGESPILIHLTPPMNVITTEIDLTPIGGTYQELTETTITAHHGTNELTYVTVLPANGQFRIKAPSNSIQNVTLNDSDFTGDVANSNTFSPISGMSQDSGEITYSIEVKIANKSLITRTEKQLFRRNRNRTGIVFNEEEGTLTFTTE